MTKIQFVGLVVRAMVLYIVLDITIGAGETTTERAVVYVACVLMSFALDFIHDRYLESDAK